MVLRVEDQENCKILFAPIPGLPYPGTDGRVVNRPPVATPLSRLIITDQLFKHSTDISVRLHREDTYFLHCGKIGILKKKMNPLTLQLGFDVRRTRTISGCASEPLTAELPMKSFVLFCEAFEKIQQVNRVEWFEIELQWSAFISFTSLNIGRLKKLISESVPTSNFSFFSYDYHHCLHLKIRDSCWRFQADLKTPSIRFRVIFRPSFFSFQFFGPISNWSKCVFHFVRSTGFLVFTIDVDEVKSKGSLVHVKLLIDVAYSCDCLNHHYLCQKSTARLTSKFHQNSSQQYLNSSKFHLQSSQLRLNPSKWHLNSLELHMNLS